MPFTLQSPSQVDLAPHPSRRLGSPIKPATVGIIDQDAAVRDALSVTLRANGFDVLAYPSASDFLDRPSTPYGTAPFGCLLIEFDLVDMTGAELVNRLHVAGLDCPVIIMSARLRMPVLGQPCPAGIVAILQKPFGQTELLTGLRRAMGRTMAIGTST